MNKKDVYKQLKEATPKKLLEAIIWFWEHAEDDHPALVAGLFAGFTMGSYDDGSDFVYGVNEGFAVTQKDGWEHVAPAWLQEVENDSKRDS